MNESNVVFKGTQNGIMVFLDQDISFEDIKIQLGKESIDKKKFFGNASANIVFKGRKLTSDQEEELLSIINEHTDLKISFIPIDNYKKPEKPAPKIKNARKNSLSDFLSNNQTNNQTFDEKVIDAKESVPKEPIPKESTPKESANILEPLALMSAGRNETFYHRGSLRSGQSISYEGSVVVLGNVNPAAIIKAHGNIIVLGSLKGVVHAGATGNSECFVAAIDFSPTQICIADLITYIPEEKKRSKRQNSSMAYIEDKKIYIAPL